MTDSDSVADNAEAFALDRAHVFHSWSAQGALKPLVFQSGSGSRLWDFEGNEYLDFSSQLVNTNIGHQHPAVVAAIQEQAAVQVTLAPQHASLVRGRTARAISEVAPPGHSKVFFTNGGADAAENAIRMARLHTGKHKVLSFYRSYHGNTGAAITATGDPRRWPNEFAYGHVHFFGPYLYRSSFLYTILNMAGHGSRITKKPPLPGLTGLPCLSTTSTTTPGNAFPANPGGTVAPATAHLSSSRPFCATIFTLASPS